MGLITTVFLICASVLASVRYIIASEPSGLFIKNHPLSYILIAFMLVFIVLAVLQGVRRYKGTYLNTEATFTPCILGKFSSIAMMVACVLTIVIMFVTRADGVLTLPIMISMIFLFLSLIYFITILSLFHNGKITSGIGGASLVPIVASAALLIVNYIPITEMATVDEYMYIILSQVVNILFFYYAANALIGKRCLAHAMIFSSIAVVMNAVAYLAPIVHVLYKQLIGEMVLYGTDLLWFIGLRSCGLVMIAFSFALLLFFAKSQKQNFGNNDK